MSHRLHLSLQIKRTTARTDEWMQKGATEWTDEWVLTYMQTDGQVWPQNSSGPAECCGLSLSETKSLKCIPTLIVVCRCSLHAVVITKTENPELKILGAPVCRQCCICSCLTRVKAGVTLPACKLSAQNDVCPDQADVKPCMLFVPHLQWGC